MKPVYHKLLVTGGLGFIGSSFIRLLLSETETTVTNLDLMTYAANPETLLEFENDARYRFIQGDIADLATVAQAARDCDAMVNFAAETHVDRSIHDAAPFIHTNVEGVRVLLEVAREAGIRLLQVSTDEVYGEVIEGLSKEDDGFKPRSPYSASKAAGDLLVQAYHTTYGLDTVITRGSNNYGPYQFPEKIVPLFITNALEGQPLPVYGSGKAIRDYIYVEDHARGIQAALERGKSGEAYNLGGRNQTDGLSIAKAILTALGQPDDLLRFVEDRPGHDYRYALDIGKARDELAWTPRMGFAEGVARTIAWYRSNPHWWSSGKDSQAEYFKRQYEARLASARK